MRDINELIGKEFEFEGKGYKVFGAKFEEDMIEMMVAGFSVRKYTYSDDGGFRVENVRDYTER